MTRSALDDIREVATYPRGIPAAADARMLVQGLLVAVNTITNRATVSIDGSSGIVMVAQPSGSYVVGNVVNVLKNPRAGADQYLCLGPTGGTTVDVPAIPVAPPTTTTATVIILPEWTGTWDTDSSRFDNWNLSRTIYGGRSTLYQGDKYGSGPLVGLATYGDQIKNLGALTIVSIEVTLRGAGLAETVFPPVKLRAATNATPAGAPAPAGATVSASPGKTGVVQVALDAGVLDGYRTGTYKSIALAGTGSGEYSAVRGTSDADGMALTVNYTRAT